VYAAVVSASAPVGLADYYIRYSLPGKAGGVYAQGLPTTVLPQVRVVGGGIDPDGGAEFVGNELSVERLVTLTSVAPAVASVLEHSAFTVGLVSPNIGPCRNFYDPADWTLPAPQKQRYVSLLPSPLLSGDQITQTGRWRAGNQISISDRLGCIAQPMIAGFPLNSDWVLTDNITVGSPIRRKAIDGSGYDASPMVVRRGGVPWVTYYWGYRLGLVASESNWAGMTGATETALASWPNFPKPVDNFELVRLPPPWVEGEVVEYVNTIDFPKSPAGQFFYAASTEERRLVDGVRSWQRTGLSFKAGGYVSVCRFYGSQTPGPNTHFFTASDTECAALRAMQVVPTPGDKQQLNFEGYKFSANVPIAAAKSGDPATCPLASVPLYRAYNNASENGYKFDSNHRFSTRRDVVTRMVGVYGWRDEGVVMCVPEAP